jgi:ribosomal protein S18 acetylase RimI-like enzyme
MLMVRADNSAARGFYERLGYLVEDTAVLGRRLDSSVLPRGEGPPC